MQKLCLPTYVYIAWENREISQINCASAITNRFNERGIASGESVVELVSLS
jgi:hypothetical protein